VEFLVCYYLGKNNYISGVIEKKLKGNENIPTLVLIGLNYTFQET